MKPKLIHVCRRYDEEYDEWTILFSFPFDQGTINELKRKIEWPHRRWNSTHKAWVITEKYRDLAEQIIKRRTGCVVCPDCRMGNDCLWWGEVARSNTHQRRETSGEQQSAQDRYNEWAKRRAGRRRRPRPEPAPQAPPPESKGRWFVPSRRERNSAWAMRVLGIQALPTMKELRKIHRALAIEWHPDINHELKGDHTMIAAINAANEYLVAYIGA